MSAIGPALAQTNGNPLRDMVGAIGLESNAPGSVGCSEGKPSQYTQAGATPSDPPETGRLACGLAYDRTVERFLETTRRAYFRGDLHR